MKVTFWGTRGSYPRIGFEDQTPIVSNHTACIELSSGKESLFIDAGTGFAKGVRNYLEKNPGGTVHLLLSHFHWDHLWGLQLIYDLHMKGIKIKVYSPDPKASLYIKTAFENPFCPLEKDLIERTFEFIQIKSLMAIGQWNVSPILIPHVGDTYAYYVEHNGKSVLYATDMDIEKVEMNRFDMFLEPGMLICDSFHLDEDKKAIGALGHSSVSEAVEFAKKIGAKHLALFHYSPDYGHLELSRMYEKANVLSAKNKIHTFLSLDNLSINLE